LAAIAAPQASAIAAAAPTVVETNRTRVMTAPETLHAIEEVLGAGAQASC
jgi:hypothetical protein